MKNISYIFAVLFLAVAVFLTPFSMSYAQDVLAPVAGEIASKSESLDTLEAASLDTSSWTNVIYFTGIGCPHCANTDPVILKDRVRRGGVMVFEYEIYRDNANAPLLMDYRKAYDAKLAVPQIIVGAGKDDVKTIAGDRPVLESFDTLVALNKGNDIVLPNERIAFDDLSFVKLPYKPKIWFKNRLAVREDSSSLQDEAITSFLVNGIVPEECAPEEKSDAPLSGGKVTFNTACRFDGWILMHD
ncbi:MAG: hypothetical protein ACLFP8_01230 [Alphaproteobacteria bacterium]